MFYCADSDIPVGTHFGPYEGQRINEEGAMESGYSWEVSVFVCINLFGSGLGIESD